MEVFLQSANLLDTIISETEKLNRDAEELVAGLTNEQLNWRPSESAWSIAVCLDHLAVTAKAWENIFTGAIQSGHRKYPVQNPPVYKPTVVGGWLIKQVAPDSRRKFKAPKVFRPAESSQIEKPLEAFLEQQQHFISFVNSSRGLDYNRTKLRSPVTPLMRYSLADAFVVSVVHNQRHLAQARRVRESTNFPARSQSQAKSA